ncbi:MAG: cysteine-rich small domain-containing protein [Oscillospiraceae bacterium]
MKNCEFFSNTSCEYFPCHETDDKENFNCLFCYCPLYALGEECGGDFCYTKEGIKDCTDCMIPHVRKNYGKIAEKLSKVIKADDFGAAKRRSK